MEKLIALAALLEYRYAAGRKMQNGKPPLIHKAG
jgi:hypothetical protein